MQDTGWARGLELRGDDERLVAHAGVLPLRLLADRTGLTGRLSAAMARRGFDPGYDRGQILLDLALVLILGSSGDQRLPGSQASGAGDRAGPVDVDGVAGFGGDR